jgi:hypothetical protein
VRLALLAIAGGLLGYLAETVHRAAGVWVLPEGAGLPLWIIPVYAVALYGAGLGFARVDRNLGKVHPVVEALLLGALFGLPPLLHTHEILLTAVATATLFGRLAVHRRPGDLGVVVAVIAADLVVEGALVATGFFRYANAAYAPLPLWLAPLWGGLGLSLRRLFRFATATAPV